MMDLQQQFARLQQQQQQKLEKRKKRKDKSDKENKTDASIAFGINDDLGLQVRRKPVVFRPVRPHIDDTLSIFYDLFDNEVAIFLMLQLAEEPKQSDSAYSEELVNHLNDQIRVNATFSENGHCVLCSY